MITILQIVVMGILLHPFWGWCNNTNVIPEKSTVRFNVLHNLNGLPEGTVNRVTHDSMGFAWIATSKGLVRFDGLKTRVYQQGKEFAQGLSSNRINDIYIDSTGIIWLLAENKLLKFDPVYELFEEAAALKYSLNLKSGLELIEIIPLDNNQFWIVQQNNAYLLIDFASDSLLLNLGMDNHFNQATELPKFQLKDSRNNYWFSGIAGFYQFRFDEYRLIEGFIPGQLLNIFRVSSQPGLVREDSHGNLYFTNNGLFVLSNLDVPENFDGIREHYFTYVDLFELQRPWDSRHHFIHDIIEDKSGLIWISTERNGVKNFRPGSPSVNTLRFVPRDINGRVGVKPYFALDQHNDLWMLFDNHVLCRYTDDQTVIQEFKNIPSHPYSFSSDAYSNRFSKNFLQDESGIYWIAGKERITFFNLGKSGDTPFRSLTPLLDNVFNIFTREQTTGKSGDDNIKTSSMPFHFSSQDPEIVFVSFKLNNEEIIPGKKYNNKLLLTKNIVNTKSIQLSESMNSFIIEFVALDYTAPQNIKYRYKLKGVLDRWIETDYDSRSVHFNLVPPGKYLLQVQSTNAMGQWTDNTTELQITISAPWWKSVWNPIVYLLLVLMVVIIFRKLFLIHLRNQREKWLEEMKVKFLVNVSHEFHTPLALIMDSLDRLLSSGINQSELTKNHLIVQQNARRLLSLVNQLGELNSLENKTARLKVYQGDVFGFIENVFHSFTHLAEKQKIKYIMIVKGGKGHLQEKPHYFDPDVLEKIIYNMLSNAFNFTPDQGEIGVHVSLSKDEDLILEISDTGPGIPPEKHKFIFDKFYQSKMLFRRKRGTGIGLTLTREMVLLHHGQINVKSKEGEGAIFKVNLPMKKSAYKSEEIVEDSPFSLMENYSS